jgi:alpha-1,6-mannosyltransferase
MVIEAVQAAGTDLPVGLIIFGDGIHRSKLQKHIHDSPHIRLFRPLYDRPLFSRILASCDALIHGSDAEPFGLVASEALASGLPLIVPDEGGCSDLALPPFAETYRARDAMSAASAIRRLFAREPTILRSAARHAAAKVRSDHDHAVELMDYYQSLIDARKATPGRSLSAVRTR